MRTQMCKFIRTGSSASANWFASWRWQKNSSVFLPHIPSISISKNLIPPTNLGKLPNHWPGRHTGFGFERWSSCAVRRHYYQTTGHENNRNPPSLSAAEPKERHKISILRRWAGYLFGSIITFWWGKQSDVLKIKGDLQKAVESVEDVAEIVENVATFTEEISKEVVEKFPKEGKIKTVAVFVERLSEEAIEDAHKTREFIDKLTKVEKTAETGVESTIEALEDLVGTPPSGHDEK